MLDIFVLLCYTLSYDIVLFLMNIGEGTMDTKKAKALFNNASKKIYNSKLTAYLVPLISLSIYLIYLIADGRITKVTGYYLIHYLYTFDHGFISRGLVGEIISRFADVVTPEITQTAVIIFTVMLLVAASLCIGYAFNRVKNDSVRFRYVLLLIIVLCILPISFKSYFVDIKLDKILWALTFFAVLLSENKIGIWFTPLLCLLATTVNPVFLFCSMILISIVLLQLFYDNHYSLKNGIICAVAYLSMIAMGIFSAASEKFTGFTSGMEMVEYYFSRYPEPLTESEKIWFAEECLFDFFEPLNVVLKQSFQIYFIEWECGISFVLNLIFAAVPIYALLIYFWKKASAFEDNKFQKFIFSLCAVSPIVTVLPIILSWESSKYFGNNILVQLCLIVYYVVHNNQAVVNALDSITARAKEHKLVSIAVIVYFSLLLKEFI